jgi:dual specificity phosphatase 12
MAYESISCILEATDQMGGLYLGGLDGAENRELLEKLGIKAIISASYGNSVQHDGMIVKYYPL